MEIDFLKPAIDSMTVLTPLSEFDVIDKSLFDVYLTSNMETGEITDMSRKPIISDVNGVKTRAYIVNFFGKEFLSITFNSKMVVAYIYEECVAFDDNGSATTFFYLDGLHSAHFFNAFLYAKKIFGFEISYDRFLDSSIVNDVDFKCDFYANDYDWNTLLNYYNQFSGSKLYFSKTENYLDSRKITGLQFVNRNDASIRNPFVKFYSKMDELKNRSGLFSDYYKVSVPNDYRRLEVTVKNHQYFKSLKALRGFENFNNLRFIFSQQHRYKDIVFELLNKYGSYQVCDKPIEEVKKVSSTPQMWLILEMTHKLMEDGYTLKQVINLVDSMPFIHANSKNRLSLNIRKQFEEFVKFKEIRNIKISPKDAFLD